MLITPLFGVQSCILYHRLASPLRYRNQTLELLEGTFDFHVSLSVRRSPALSATSETFSMTTIAHIGHPMGLSSLMPIAPRFTTRASTDQDISPMTSVQEPQQQQPSRSVPGMASFRQYSYPQYATATGSQDSLISSVRPSLTTSSSYISTADTDMTSPVSPPLREPQPNLKPHQSVSVQTNGASNLQSPSSASHGRLKTPENQAEMGREDHFCPLINGVLDRRQ